jgi:hypothetical protein
VLVGIKGECARVLSDFLDDGLGHHFRVTDAHNTIPQPSASVIGVESEKQNALLYNIQRSEQNELCRFVLAHFLHMRLEDFDDLLPIFGCSAREEFPYGATAFLGMNHFCHEFLATVRAKQYQRRHSSCQRSKPPSNSAESANLSNIS